MCRCGDWNKYRILPHVSRLDPGWPEQKVLPLTIMTTDPSASLSVILLAASQARTSVKGLSYNLPVLNLHLLCTLSSRYILYLIL